MRTVHTDRAHLVAAGSAPLIGLALTRIGHGRYHIGLLGRRWSTEEPHVLHLSWHNDLKCEPLSHVGEKYIFLVLDLPRSLALALAGLMFSVASFVDDNHLCYGFSSPTPLFEPSGEEFLIGGVEHALTCATFVLSFFSTYTPYLSQVGMSPIDLLTIEGWPERIGDREWQHKIIAGAEKELERLKGKATENALALRREALEAMHRQVDARARRYRPEEVFGAGACSRLPASFWRATIGGEFASDCLEEKLRGRF